MALAVGNKTNNLTTLNGTSTITISHNHNTGSDGYLFVFVAVPTGTGNFSGITYNGVSMTQVDSRTTNITSWYWRIYKLAAPATGANNLVVSLAANAWGPVSTFIVSFTGCDGAGVSGFSDVSGPPNSLSLTVSANSRMIACVSTGSSFTTTVIDGSNYTNDFIHNIYNYCGGAVSNALSSGSRSCSSNSTAQYGLFAVEVKEKAAAGRRMRAIVVS